jgi:hypothetical protein
VKRFVFRSGGGGGRGGGAPTKRKKKKERGREGGEFRGRGGHPRGPPPHPPPPPPQKKKKGGGGGGGGGGVRPATMRGTKLAARTARIRPPDPNRVRAAQPAGRRGARPKSMRTRPEEEKEELARRLTRNSGGSSAERARTFAGGGRWRGTDERGAWRRRCAAE